MLQQKQMLQQMLQQMFCWWSDTLWAKARRIYIYIYIYTYIYIYIYIWNLRVDPKHCFFAKDCRGNQCCASSAGDWEGCILLLYTTWRKRLHMFFWEYRLLAAGLRHLGLGTWPPAILEYRLLAAGLRHLGLGTWHPAILDHRRITIQAK